MLSIVCKPAYSEKNLVPPVTYLRPLWWTFKTESLFNVKKTKFENQINKIFILSSDYSCLIIVQTGRNDTISSFVIITVILLQIGRNFNTKDWTTKIIWLFSTCLKNCWFEMFHLLFSYFLLAAALDFWRERFSTMS